MSYICEKLRNFDNGFKKKGPDAQVLLMFMLEHAFDYINKYSAVWALKNPKVEVSWHPTMQPWSEGHKVKNFMLSKSCRVFNFHHFRPFPDEKYSKLTILDHFWWNGRFSYGSTFDPILDPHMTKKKIFHNIFFPSFSCRFRKKNPFCRIFTYKNDFCRIFTYEGFSQNGS